MKQKIIFTTIIALVLSSQLVTAGSITDTYTTGDTLTATKMENIKTVVNSKQDRVTGVCPPGEAIGEIKADGTVDCEADTDTLGALTCPDGNHIVRVGGGWGCSMLPSRSINFNLHSARPFGGAAVGPGFLRLPETSPTPGFAINFTVPEDATNTQYVVAILFQSLNPGPWSGTVELFTDIGGVYKAGAPLPPSNPTITTPLPDFTLLSFTPTVQRVEFAFDLSYLGPLIEGTSVNFFVSRDTQDPTFDTHTGDIAIRGIHITYTAVE